MKTIKIMLLSLCLSTAISCNQQPEVSDNSDNAVIENIMSRRSIRKYKAEPVNHETMEKILECGINAPNAINKQAWEVRVINDPETMEEFIGHLIAASPDVDPVMVRGCLRGAPTMVIVANDTEFRFSPIDCGLLSENIILSGWSLGVGSVCLGSPVDFIKKSAEAMKMLKFSAGYEPIICIGMGYADEAPEAKPRDFSKVQFVK